MGLPYLLRRHDANLHSTDDPSTHFITSSLLIPHPFDLNELMPYTTLRTFGSNRMCDVDAAHRMDDIPPEPTKPLSTHS